VQSSISAVVNSNQSGATHIQRIPNSSVQVVSTPRMQTTSTASSLNLPQGKVKLCCDTISTILKLVFCKDFVLIVYFLCF